MVLRHILRHHVILLEQGLLREIVIINVKALHLTLRWDQIIDLVTRDVDRGIDHCEVIYKVIAHYVSWLLVCKRLIVHIRIAIHQRYLRGGLKGIAILVVRVVVQGTAIALRILERCLSPARAAVSSLMDLASNVLVLTSRSYLRRVRDTVIYDIRARVIFIRVQSTVVVKVRDFRQVLRSTLIQQGL